MPILLYRVDERLIHGQVVIGWGHKLHPDRYLVVDDRLAGSDWEQELYELGLSEDARAEFHTVEEARRRLDEWRGSEERSVLLIRDVESLMRLGEGGTLQGEGVNLGGLHHAAGRTEVLPYLYLDDEDRARLRELEESGVEITARDVPGAPKVRLGTLLG